MHKRTSSTASWIPSLWKNCENHIFELVGVVFPKRRYLIKIHNSSSILGCEIGLHIFESWSGRYEVTQILPVMPILFQLIDFIFKSGPKNWYFDWSFEVKWPLEKLETKLIVEIHDKYCYTDMSTKIRKSARKSIKISQKLIFQLSIF